MGNSEDLDIIALARAAKAKGYDDPSRLAKYLEAVIRRNVDYLAYRRNAGRRGAYNEVVAQDNEVLAMVVVWLESVE